MIVFVSVPVFGILIASTYHPTVTNRFAPLALSVVVQHATRLGVPGTESSVFPPGVSVNV